MQKCGELLIRQAQPEERSPARSTHTGAGAVPFTGELLAPEAAPGRHSPRARPGGFRLVPPPAQPKRAVPVQTRLSAPAEQERFINQRDNTDRK